MSQFFQELCKLESANLVQMRAMGVRLRLRHIAVVLPFFDYVSFFSCFSHIEK